LNTVDVKYKLVRSARRTISVEVLSGGEVVVRAPYRMPVYEIESFLEKRSGWISSHVKIAENRTANYAKPINSEASSSASDSQPKNPSSGLDMGM